MAGQPKRAGKRPGPTLMHVRLINAWENLRGALAKLDPDDADMVREQVIVILTHASGVCRDWRMGNWGDYGDAMRNQILRNAVFEVLDGRDLASRDRTRALDDRMQQDE